MCPAATKGRGPGVLAEGRRGIAAQETLAFLRLGALPCRVGVHAPANTSFGTKLRRMWGRRRGARKGPEVTRGPTLKLRPAPGVGSIMAHITINQYLQQVMFVGFRCTWSSGSSSKEEVARLQGTDGYLALVWPGSVCAPLARWIQRTAPESFASR